MTDFDLAAAQDVLAGQPFSRLIGTTLTAFEPGRAVLGPLVLTAGVTIDYVRPVALGPLRTEAGVSGRFPG